MIESTCKAIINREFEDYIDVIIQLSELIHIPISSDEENDNDNTNEVKENKDMKNAKSRNSLFLQMIILFSTTKLNNMLKMSRHETYGLSK